MWRTFWRLLRESFGPALNDTIVFLLLLSPLYLGLILYSAQDGLLRLLAKSSFIIPYLAIVFAIHVGLIYDFIVSFDRLLARTYTAMRAAFLVFVTLAKTALLIIGTVWCHAVIFAAGGLCTASPCLQSNIASRDIWDAVYFSIVTWTTVGYGDFFPSIDVRLYAATLAVIGVFALAFQIGAATALMSSLLEER